MALDALKIIGEGGLPMLGIGATSEDMQGHPLYRQISYDNPYQASMFVAFARQANIVRLGESDRCAPAGNAVVIGDPTDNYSLRLGEDIAGKFGIDHDRIIWYPSQNGVTSEQVEGTFVYNDTDLIDKACTQLARSPDDTVVFWSGRAERLRDFLGGAKDSAACPASFTVVSGADLATTAVLKEQFPTSFAGVTLYFSAHALTSRSPNSAGAEYDSRYVDTYKTRNDAWYDHWRGSVASHFRLPHRGPLRASGRDGDHSFRPGSLGNRGAHASGKEVLDTPRNTTGAVRRHGVRAAGHQRSQNIVGTGERIRLPGT